MDSVKFNVDGFIFYVFFETIQENTATIPLYYFENSPPMPKNVRRDYLIENIKSILPSKIDKSLKWRNEIVSYFWRLLDSHYAKYNNLVPTDAEYYTALLSLLDISILKHLGLKMNLKMRIKQNQTILESVSQKYSIPIQIHFSGGKQTNFNLVFSDFPVLATENIILTPFFPQDTEDLLDIMRDKSFVEEFHLPDGEGTFDKVYERIIQFQQTFQQQKSISWAVRKKDTGKIIGFQDLFFGSPYAGVITQSFFLQNYRNKGYSQEALHTIINFLRQANAPFLMFDCNVNNAPVIHIANKLGFVDVTPTEFEEVGRKLFKFLFH